MLQEIHGLKTRITEDEKIVVEAKTRLRQNRSSSSVWKRRILKKFGGMGFCEWCLRRWEEIHFKGPDGKCPSCEMVGY